MKNLIPEGLTGKALFEYIVKNEAMLIHAKKSQIKKADASSFCLFSVNEKGELVSKETQEQDTDPNRLKRSLVINTTNLLDSHQDVHIPGLWNKTIRDNKQGFYLLRSHGWDFEHVIGDSMKAEARKMSWLELGAKYSGITEALVFTGELKRERNPFMFDQYKSGYVKQHSVGMRYVKIVTCINDEEYPVQKENWDKYIDEVANKEVAEKTGFFWAVLEAEIKEGSAVLFGSNPITPTLSEIPKHTSQPANATADQPPSGTEKTEVNWDNLVSIINSKI